MQKQYEDIFYPTLMIAPNRLLLIRFCTNGLTCSQEWLSPINCRSHEMLIFITAGMILSWSVSNSLDLLFGLDALDETIYENNFSTLNDIRSDGWWTRRENLAEMEWLSKTYPSSAMGYNTCNGFQKQLVICREM